MFDRSTFWFAASLRVGALMSIVQFQPAFAATHEQIIEQCKQALMPQIRACAQAKGLKKGDPEVRQQCGMIVRPCVLREEQKQAAHAAVPVAPTEQVAAPTLGAAPVPTAFIAPPRTIADITAILDSEKPDAAKIAARQAAADAPPPNNASSAKLTQFYYDRGATRALLARNKDALADELEALTIAKNGVDFIVLARVRNAAAQQYKALGDPKQAMAMYDSTIREGNVVGNGRRGSVIVAMTNLAQVLISIGKIDQASAYAGHVEALVQEARGSPAPLWRAAYPIYANTWESDIDLVRALVFEARGQYAEAEGAYRRAEAFRRASLKDLAHFYDFPPPPEQFVLLADNDRLSIARNEAKQGRLSEAEADARTALLEVLKQLGKYAPATPRFIIGLAAVLVEQGRYEDAEKLARSALEVQRTIGIADDAPETASILSQLGNILIAERKAKDAAVVYAELAKAIAQWPPEQRDMLQLNGSRIAALYATGQIDAGVAAAERLVKRQAARTGENSYDTASAHGTLAIGYARSGRDADAIREFKAALPVLMAATHETDDDDPTLVAARSARLQKTVEAYIGVLASSTAVSNDVAVETFSLADAIRGHAVQQALADSSARVVAKDPSLAALVRTEQDAAKEINAQLGALNNLLSLSSDQRDSATVAGINAEIEKLRADRKTARQQINKQFPAYADLIGPKPPTVDEIRAALRPGEALLSFYFGQDASFVWAVPKDGNVAFAAVPATALDLEAKVQHAAQGARAAGHDGLGHPAVRLDAGLRALQRASEAGRGRLAARQEPDRGDQRSARRIAAEPVTHRTFAGRCPASSRPSPAIAMCRGSPAATP